MKTHLTLDNAPLASWPTRALTLASLALAAAALAACGGDDGGGGGGETDTCGPFGCSTADTEVDTSTADTDSDTGADTGGETDTGTIADTGGEGDTGSGGDTDTGAPVEANCTDGTDDDGDGQTDCDDSDCAGTVACPTTETACGDGADDDRDGATDCADSDCAGDAACPGCASCAAANKACTDAGPPAVCGDCLAGFVPDGAVCSCDQTACAEEELACVGNSVESTSFTNTDTGETCECISSVNSVDCAATRQICSETGGAHCEARPTIANPWIAFLRGSTGDPSAQFWAVRADGSDERRLTNITGTKGSFAWSADGRTAYFTMRTAAGYRLHSLNVETGAAPTEMSACPDLTSPYAISASPSGTALAVQNYDLTNADFGILRFDLTTNACAPIIDSDANDESSPSYATCEGEQIITYIEARHGSSTFAVKSAPETGATSGTPASLTQFLGSPTIDPDCSKMCYSKNVADVPTLFCGDFASRRISRDAAVTGSSADDSPAFMPNGLQVAATRVYTEGDAINPDVVLIHISTGAVTRLTNSAGYDGTPHPAGVESSSVNIVAAP